MWGPLPLPETTLINTLIKDFFCLFDTSFVIFLYIMVILASSSSSSPKEIIHVLIKAVNNTIKEITDF